MARVWKFGADVDTDQIVPGRYAPYMRPGEDVGQFAFVEARPEFARDARPGDVIVAGANFGCGSSREYAPEALRRRGVGAIVAPSFARIFYRNAINLGIPVFESAEIAEAFQDGDEVTLDLAAGVLEGSSGRFALPPLPAFVAEILAAGGIAAYVKRHGRFPGESPLDAAPAGGES
jgi:methanogen homoaconitase small subunit